MVTPNNIPTLTVGGRVFTDLSNLIILTGNCSGSSSGNGTLRKAGGTSGYTPSGSKTFVAKAIKVAFGTAGGLVQILYADVDIGASSATVFTNPVYIGGAPNSSAEITGATSSIQESVLPDFIIPNGKFMCTNKLASATACTIQVFGYEV